MKRNLLLTLISFLMTTTTFSQSTLNTDDFTWFGIDYTQCYYLTPIDFPSISDLEAKIKAWNDLVIYEREKYITKTLKGKNVSFAIDAVSDINKNIDVKSMLSEDESKFNHLDPVKIENIINNYNIDESLSGTGLVFIAECYNKPIEQGAYYVTFFDIKSKKIFNAERFTGKASGFGFRNYWAGSFYSVLKNLGKKYK